MPSIITRGAFSAGALGFGASQGQAVYVEDVFSTYLYTGNGSAQTITNNIDLSTKGGMVWIKQRSGTRNNNIVDTVRGGDNMLYTDSTIAQFSLAGLGFSPFSFSSTGYSYSNASVDAESAQTFASWTFRKQPKFFDVVSYSGDGVSGRTVSHALGSTPGMIIIKQINGSNYWVVYNRGLGATKYLTLNTTDAATTGSYIWNDTAPTATDFTLGYSAWVNGVGGTYIAYLFAHDAGGFGAAGTDSVVSCGSYTAPSAGTQLNINLGWEPQFVMVKRSSDIGGWLMMDNMRGMPVPTASEPYLYANSSSSESTYTAFVSPYANGFYITGNASTPEVSYPGSTYIYLAIRRGPMKTPTDATKVFVPVNSTVSTPAFPSSFVADMGIVLDTGGSSFYPNITPRLVSGNFITTSSTNAENSSYPSIFSFNGFQTGWGTSTFTSNYYSMVFGRAPGFFDCVCYSGTGSATTVSHNLGVAPELMIVKRRNGGTGYYWLVYNATLGATKNLWLNLTNASNSSATTYWNNTTPTSSVFTLGTDSDVNDSAGTYVAYLFATCPGVSKVGTYTGTGASQAIACGFSAGARFVLIKRTDSTGDWYVYNTARGMSSGSDPYNFLNISSAEQTGTNYVNSTTGGFTLTASAPAGLNANGGTYIFLAVA